MRKSGKRGWIVPLKKTKVRNLPPLVRNKAKLSLSRQGQGARPEIARLTKKES